MNTTNIKFKRNVVDGRTNHLFETGTKHLPPLYVAGSGKYGWEAYAIDGGKQLTPFGRSYYNRFSTLKEIKGWISEYDGVYEARIAKEKEEKEAQVAKMLAKKEEEENLEEGFCSYISRPFAVSVGDMVKGIQFPNLNKNCYIGEYLAQILHNNYDVSPGKVIAIIEMSDSEYDEFVQGGLMNDRDDFIDGGFVSDDPRLPEDWNEVVRNPEMLKIYRETAYALVHAVTAPSRQTLFVNTEGYSYARYVGF